MCALDFEPWILPVKTAFVKRRNQHEDQRAISGRKASHFKDDKRGKLVRAIAQA